MRIAEPLLPLLLAASLAAVAQAHEREGADAFLRRLYAPYVAGDARVAPTGKAAPTLFDARLTALIRED